MGNSLLIEPGLALPLLAGDIKSEAGAAAVESISAYSLRISLYFLGLTVVGSILGKLLNRVLRSKHNATWYALLHPGDADFIWLTADIKLDNECYLIAGIVQEFHVTQDGKLERVVLCESRRRPLHCEGEARGKPNTIQGWTPIPGEFMVLMMDHVRTINIDYYYIVEEPDSTDSAEVETHD